MIGPFIGEYRFLSNFWPAAVQLDGIKFRSVEHAYQAAKTTDVALRIRIAEAETPAVAKRIGRNFVKIRQDWNTERIPIMAYLLEQKFREPTLRRRLLATAPHELVEVNTWGDTFWGVCNGVGQNNLGKLLMACREAISK